MKKVFIIALFVTGLTSCDILSQFVSVKPGKVPLTESEIIAGLKEALNVGTRNAVGFLSQEGTFYNNLNLRVPFPPDAKKVEDKLRQVGMGKMVDDFIVNMNKGAGEAVKEATPIFADAVKQMTFSDARNILNGPQNAATEYFKQKTTTQLFNLFKPKVQATLDRVQVTKYWGDLTAAYNKIPLVTPVETDLAKYVTEMAMDRLFGQIAIEEQKIRTDPAARVTDILKRVFGQ